MDFKEIKFNGYETTLIFSKGKWKIGGIDNPRFIGASNVENAIKEYVLFLS